jgi:hypothetical protein
VSNDQLVLQAQNLPNGVFVLYLQGEAAVNGGLGSPFNDGHLCVTTNLVRFGVDNSGPRGNTTYPGPGDPKVSVAGNVPPAGATRYYHVFYRNVGGPCATLANTTNGVSVIWQP